MRRPIGIGLFVALGVMASGEPGAAQVLPPAGARALGLAGISAASPSGAEAVALNPAASALPGKPRASFTLLPLAAGWNVAPVRLSELSEVAGSEIPRATREAWMERIGARGSLTGAVTGSFTGAAARIGRLGLQISSGVHGSMSMNEDAAELVLFGNAGRTGTPRDMVLEGSFLDAGAMTTFGASWAVRLDDRLPPPFGGGETGGFAVGALVTYSLGHALVLGRDMGSLVGADPPGIDLLFPVVYTAEATTRAGDGVGLTLAAAWSRGPWSLGAVLHDAVNTFRWKEGALSFRPGQALLDGSGSESDFQTRPFSEAPGALRTLVRSRTPSSRATLAGSWRATEDLELFVDAGRGFGSDLAHRSRTRLGVGTEYGRSRRVPLRAGVQLVSGGARVAGGVGLRLGNGELSAGGQHRTGSGRGETAVGVSLTLISHR